MSAAETTPAGGSAAASFHLRPSPEPIPLRIHHWEQCHAACNSEGSDDSSSVASTSASVATTSNASAGDSCTSEVRMYHEQRLTERMDTMEDDDEYDDDDDDDYEYENDVDESYDNDDDGDDDDNYDGDEDDDPDNRHFGYVLGYGFDHGDEITDEMDCDDEDGEGEDSNRLEAAPGGASTKQTSDDDISKTQGVSEDGQPSPNQDSEKVLGKKVANCSICHSFIRSRDKFSGLSGTADKYTWIRPNHQHEWDAAAWLTLQEWKAAGIADAVIKNFVFHNDCFNVIRRYSPRAADLVWILAAWKGPWIEDPIFDQDPLADIPDILHPVLADRLGLPGLAKLSQELSRAIRRHSCRSALWRFHTLRILAGGLWCKLTETGRLSSYPVLDIKDWHRGREPELAPSGFSRHPTRPMFLRIITDAWGLVDIQRVHAVAPFDGTLVPGRRHATVHERTLAGVDIVSKFGFTRLNKNLNVSTWETPTPPDLQQCRYAHYALPQMPSHYYMTPLAGVTGLTFFYSCGDVFAVHLHTAESPCADVTHARLVSTIPPGGLVWWYLPLSTVEPILRLCTRELVTDPEIPGKQPRRQRAFMLVTDRGRCLTVGPTLPNGAGAIDGILDYPEMLVQSFVPRQTNWVQPFIGAYSRDHLWRPFNILFPPQPLAAPFPDAYWASAIELNDIRTMHVFHDKGKLCVGIVCEYVTGDRRALGECRVGIGASVTYEWPGRFCFEDTFSVTKPTEGPVQRHASRVQCRTLSEPHEHDAGDWHCHLMAGHIGMWFNQESTRVVYLPGYGGV